MNENTTSAKIVADSINPNGDRLTTFVCTGPRYILAEVNTHRMLSRNAASSRAIPTQKLLKRIRENPVLPAQWGSNKAGMQSGAVLEGDEAQAIRDLWLEAAAQNATYAEKLTDLGLHKQWANRWLEPAMQWTGLISSTDWRNFFALRAHPDAQPDFQELAFKMLKLYLENVPEDLAWGEWHLPFGDQLEASWDLETRMQVCTSRAARLSYLTFEGELDVEKDKSLYKQLMLAHPLHASPAEHPAQAVPNLWLNTDTAHRQMNIETPLDERCSWITTKRDKTACNSWPLPYDVNMTHQGNYRGWTQWRKMCHGENAAPSDNQLQEMLNRCPDWIKL